jgi:hypothetical protein
MDLICHFAVKRIQPNKIIGEFANIAIVIACKKTGFFDYKIATNAPKNVLNFLDIDKKLYDYAIHNTQLEFARVKAMIRNEPHLCGHMFDELTRERDGLTHFYGGNGGCLTDNPAQEVERIYARYIKHGTPINLFKISVAT